MRISTIAIATTMVVASLTLSAKTPPFEKERQQVDHPSPQYLEI